MKITEIFSWLMILIAGDGSVFQYFNEMLCNNIQTNDQWEVHACANMIYLSWMSLDYWMYKERHFPLECFPSGEVMKLLNSLRLHGYCRCLYMVIHLLIYLKGKSKWFAKAYSVKDHLIPRWEICQCCFS